MRPSISMLALNVSILALTACAENDKPPPITYDNSEFKAAAVEPETPKPVQIVEVPSAAPLSGQLLPPPTSRGSHEAALPPARVEAANKAAIQEPTGHGYVNAVQVYPFSSPDCPGADGPVSVFDFDKQPSAGYAEGYEAGRTVEAAHEVVKLAAMFDHLRASALSPRDSASWIAALRE